MRVKLGLTLRDEHTLKVFRGIFGPKRKWWETTEDCIMWISITYTLHQILLGWWDGRGM